MALRVTDAVIGQTLGHYRIIEKIGAGGMGEVYRAHDEHLERDAAIKILHPQIFVDDSARKHFREEALTLSTLNHPAIATVYDFDTQAGVDFLVMEYVPGTPLSEKLAAGPLSEREVIRLGRQLAEGLAAAHEQAIIHRDLKPGNLRLTPDGRLKSGKNWSNGASPRTRTSAPRRTAMSPCSEPRRNIWCWPSERCARSPPNFNGRNCARRFPRQVRSAPRRTACPSS